MPPRPRTFSQLTDRRRSILGQTRALAAEAGWEAVTMRAVASRIGLTPPALYEQFPGGKADLLAAVAGEGFDELAETLERAAAGPGAAPPAIAEGYWRFAQGQPALYELMLHRGIEMVFATDETPPPARRAFAVFRRAVAAQVTAAGRELDVELISESWWASLHGVVSLALSHRVRPGADHARLLVRTVTDSLIATIDNKEPT